MRKNEKHCDCKKSRKCPRFETIEYCNGQMSRVYNVPNGASFERYQDDVFLDDKYLNDGYYDDYLTSDSYVNKCNCDNHNKCNCGFNDYRFDKCNKKYNEWCGFIRFIK